MEQAELEQIIEKARIDRSTELCLSYGQLASLPNSISTLSDLSVLDLSYNQLTSLPKSISHLSGLTTLYLHSNQLNSLHNSFSHLSKLSYLDLSFNRLTSLPESIGNLSALSHFDLSFNQLSNLPKSIGNLHKLTYLQIANNKLHSLPQNISMLANLISLRMDRNPIQDLSVLRDLSQLRNVWLFSINLPRQYWTKFSNWQSQWLMDENNAEIRRVLIEILGYEKICDDLNTNNLDSWREYTLLKIDGVEKIDDEYSDELLDREPILLLKMTCPSTGHIHILRVSPEMTSAEAAITWVNHGIHPDRFAIQT
jgi:leucine-rich repeat protein SHOC2